MAKTKVLIVEDYRPLAETLEYQLTRAGYEVFRAADGGDALTQAADHAFIGGLHIAAGMAAVLAASTSLVVLRYLPKTVKHRSESQHAEAAAASILAPVGGD